MGVIKLKSKLQFTKGISSVCLSRTSTDGLKDDGVSLFGWGSTSLKKEDEGKPSKFLRGTYQLRVTSVGNCKRKISRLTYEENSPNIAVFHRTSWLKTNTFDGEKSMEGLICVEDIQPNGLIGSCKGDSGSPVTKLVNLPHGGRMYEQIGIVSGGRCSDSSAPTVLTHIGHERVLKFILNHSKFIMSSHLY